MSDPSGRLASFGKRYWVEPHARRDYLALLVWCLFLFTISAIPGNDYPDVKMRHADKMVHFLVYTPLGLLALRAFRYKIRSLIMLVPTAWVFGALYGASDEFHQRFVPFRTCSISDWYVDLTAVAFGILMFYLIGRYYPAWTDETLYTTNNAASFKPTGKA